MPASSRLYWRQMTKKRKVRELAMQVLFVWDTNGSADSALAEQVIGDGSDDPEIRRQAMQWAGAAWEQREMTDARIERLAPHWPVRRQPGVDRALLRMSIWELNKGETPPKVVIDEAIELAKQFSTEQSAAFVNGVLDTVLKENQSLIKED